MPKENVERAIKKATDKDTANYKEVLFEGYAPHGIAILIETATAPTAQNSGQHQPLTNAIIQYGGCRWKSGLISRSAPIRIPSVLGILENLELELIDFGAEEVFEDEDGILIYAPFGSFGVIQKELENRKIEILSSGFEKNSGSDQATHRRPGCRCREIAREN